MVYMVSESKTVPRKIYTLENKSSEKRWFLIVYSGQAEIRAFDLLACFFFFYWFDLLFHDTTVWLSRSTCNYWSFFSLEIPLVYNIKGPNARNDKEEYYI